LKLRGDKPSKTIAAILKPVINEDQDSPPRARAILDLFLILRPNRTSVQGRTDLPIDQNNYPIKNIEFKKFLRKKSD